MRVSKNGTHGTANKAEGAAIMQTTLVEFIDALEARHKELGSGDLPIELSINVNVGKVKYKIQFNRLGKSGVTCDEEEIAKWRKFGDAMREAWKRVTIKGRPAEPNFSDMMDELDKVYPAAGKKGGAA